MYTVDHLSHILWNYRHHHHRYYHNNEFERRYAGYFNFTANIKGEYSLLRIWAVSKNKTSNKFYSFLVVALVSGI